MSLIAYADWDTILKRLGDHKSAFEKLTKVHVGPNRAARRAMKKATR